MTELLVPEVHEQLTPRPATRALAQRLRAVADTLLSDVPLPSSDPAEEAGQLVELLLADLVRDPDPSRAWLTFTGASSSVASLDDVDEFVHRLRSSDLGETTTWFLRTTATAARLRGAVDHELEIVQDRVVALVDYCARADVHTGIQRVTRETVPRLAATHPVLPVAWTDRGWTMRTLEPVEVDRVMSWNDRQHLGRPVETRGSYRLVVPWHTTVLLMEVVLPPSCPAMVATARYARSRIVAIGYDTIPMTSADVRPPSEADGFVAYLDVLLHSELILGISEAAAAEFTAVISMRSAAGVQVPRSVAVTLPVEAPASTLLASAPRSTPLVVVVGSQEKHKNHLAVLAAAEALWKEGEHFELWFIGRRGWGSEELAERVAVLRRRGRRVALRAGLGDAELVDAYRSARFSVFASLHEGFGLPVAESLDLGVPVITSRYGSMAEIASDGGCLTVDPRSDSEITDAMRLLLRDDALRDRLRAEAARRPPRTWDQYADAVWASMSKDHEPREAL